MITFEELEAAIGKDYGDDGGRFKAPEGWLTSRQWAKQWGVSIRTAQYRIADAIDADKELVSVAKFSVAGINGSLQLVAHYKFNLPDHTEDQSP